MHVKLKHINQVTKRLANGEIVTYWYAWKGGPRIFAEPDTPEFVAEYNNAINARATAPGKWRVLADLTDAFERSQEFKRLAETTRLCDGARIRRINAQFGDFPLSAFKSRETRGVFLDWRDKIAEHSPAEADLHYGLIRRMLNWGIERGRIDFNPLANTKRLYEGSRIEKVWSLEEEAVFLKRMPNNMSIAYMSGVWTGQRERDLLRFCVRQYTGTHLRFEQQKRRGPGVRFKRLVIPVARPLKVKLDAWLKEIGLDPANPDHADRKILLNAWGRPWASGQSFSHAFAYWCEKAGIEDRTFHDLRGTAVTRLAIAGCSVPQIASITGHSLKDVETILDKHYLYRDPRLSADAIRGYEESFGYLHELPTALPTDEEPSEPGLEISNEIINIDADL